MNATAGPEVTGVLDPPPLPPPDPLGWVTDAGRWVWAHLHTQWPLLVALLAAVVAVHGLVVLWRGRARRHAARLGTWLMITSPARVPADGALALWQTLSGLLHRARPERIAPRRLAMEFTATPAGMSAGVWVPPAIPAAAVAAALRLAWPGAVITPTHNRPPWPPAVSAVELRPRGGPWAPLVEPNPRLLRPAPDTDEEPLRAVLTALARRGLGEQAAVQVVVCATRGGAASRWPVRVLGAALRVAGAIVLELADTLLPGHHAPIRAPLTGQQHRRAAPADPARAAHLKAVEAKQASGPHLRTTLRVAVATRAGVPVGARRFGIARIAGGFDIAAPAAALRTRHLIRPVARLAQRRHGRGFLATLPELAALWHIPPEPSRYRLAAQPARNRPPEPGLPQHHGGALALISDPPPHPGTGPAADAGGAR